MLSGLTPQSLGMALDAYERGEFSRAALLWRSIALRDDVIACVKPKREKAVARRDWQILSVDGSATAAAHQATLDEFWSNITAYDALNRNDRGGVSKLIRQMMQSQSYGFAAHHLVWQPSRLGLTCAFESAPLWHFENRTGEFRFLPTGMEVDGIDMPQSEWMITVGEPLMIAGSIGYLAKRNSMADWMVFSEKFGVPGILGKTSQAQDSEGGRAMQEAIETFSSDWEAVLFGDDGSGKIELIQASGSSATLPFPALIDRIDRRLAALWRGADLSSMSATQGQGQGASLQQDEIDLIETDDALLISETLNEIERRVIAWHYGPRVKPMAYFRLSTPQREDLNLLLSAVTKLVELGGEVGVQNIMERFGIEQPKKGDPLLRAATVNPVNPVNPVPASDLDPITQTEINAQRRDRNEELFLARAARLLAGAAADDRADMVDDLRVILNTDDANLATATESFLGKLPDRIGQDQHQITAWETLLASSLVNGLALAKPQ